MAVGGWCVSVVGAVGGLGLVCVMRCFPHGLSRNNEILTVRKRTINGRRFSGGKQTDRVNFAKEYKSRVQKMGDILENFIQIQDVEFWETFDPTPAAASVKIAVAVGNEKNCFLRHLDVKQTFIQA